MTGIGKVLLSGALFLLGKASKLNQESYKFVGVDVGRKKGREIASNGRGLSKSHLE